MNFRERIVRTFQKKKVDQIVWQPRIYYWYYGNRLKNKLPEGYKERGLLDTFYEIIQAYQGNVPGRYNDKTMLEIYDDLGASPRYPLEVLGINIFKTKNKKVKIRTAQGKEKEEKIGTIQEGVTVHETPIGTLREVIRHGYHTEYPIKTIRDMKIMKYILDDTQFEFDPQAFEIADREFGERGVVQAFFPGAQAPFQRLIIYLMGFENTVYALNDNPKELKDLLRVVEECDDRMYEVILSSPLKIINFGDNIDSFIDPPPLFKEYLVPYYQKRTAQIHQEGKFCHLHMDGSLKPLLPFLNQMGFDGIEAATPLPQGDVTLEELKEALGDIILLDGIPAILFLPKYSLDELEEFVLKVLEMFSPNLVLGVSDEVPPPADIEKVKFVSEIVQKFKA